MDISVVLPVLNEGGNLGDLLQRLRNILVLKVGSGGYKVGSDRSISA